MIVPASVEMRCPKCENSLRKTVVYGLYEVDVAHSGETWEVAERRIMDACSRAIFGQHKGLKVIHGYGSAHGHTAMIRTSAIPLLRRLATQFGGKVVPDRQNPGAHILYFN